MQFMEKLKDMPTLLRQLIAKFFTIRTMLKIKMFLMVFAFLLYFLSPFDIVPEAFFGIIGIVDDIFVVFILLFAMSNMFYNSQSENYL
jgi:RING finger protein 170